MIDRSDPHVANNNEDGGCSCEMASFPVSWITSVSVLAGPAAPSESAAAKAVQKRMITVTRNCRPIASTLMIKVNSTRCSFRSQEKNRPFHKGMFHLQPPLRGSVRYCMNPRSGSLRVLGLLGEF